MSFTGKVPEQVRAVLATMAEDWHDVKDVYVGCTGNLTLETSLPRGRFDLHGCDVNVYSVAIGRLAAGIPIGMQLQPKWAAALPWLADSVVDDDTLAAAITLCMDYEMQLRPERDGAYYKRMRAGIARQWPELMAKTVAKIKERLPKLVEFRAEDAWDFMGRAPRDAAALSYPPFMGAATMFSTGPYEAVAEMFGYEEPPYALFDAERFQAYVQMIMEFRHWMIGSNKPIPGMEEHLRGVFQRSNRGIVVYQYSDGGPKRVVQVRRPIEPVLAPRLAPGEEVEGPLRLVSLTAPQFTVLQSTYMNKDIVPALPLRCYGVVAGERLVGGFSTFVNEGAGSDIVLLSDFAVAPTDYKKLSKLVLMAVLSKEARALYDISTKKRKTRMVTLAYSNNAVSMKYRGLFELMRRTVQVEGKKLSGRPGEGGSAGKKYALGYGSDTGRWTLEEGLAEWQKKYAQRRTA